MSREIKFRVFDKVNNEMCEWYELVNNPTLLRDCLSASDSTRVDIMQFTGLKDKHEKECFEGDIYRDTIEVNDLTGDDEYLYFVCAYVKSQSAFCWVGSADYELGFHLLDYLPEDIEDYCTVTSYDIDKMQIIGNIHEHKHLLK